VATVIVAMLTIGRVGFVCLTFNETAHGIANTNRLSNVRDAGLFFVKVAASPMELLALLFGYNMKGHWN
jgi:hypothetical protein